MSDVYANKLIFLTFNFNGRISMSYRNGTSNFSVSKRLNYHFWFELSLYTAMLLCASNEFTVLCD